MSGHSVPAKERLLCIDDLTLTVTFRTGDRGCTRLCAGSVTLRTLILQGKLDLLLTSKDRLLKRDTDTRSQVCSAHRTIAASSVCGTSTKEISEDISENVSHIGSVKVESAVSGSACASVKSCMTELVVLLSLFRIT